MNGGEFGGKITLVRVGGQGGNDTGDECGHFGGKQIDPSKLTKQQSDGQVYRKTKRQMDRQTARARERMMEMKKKLKRN